LSLGAGSDEAWLVFAISHVPVGRIFAGLHEATASQLASSFVWKIDYV